MIENFRKHIRFFEEKLYTRFHVYFPPEFEEINTKGTSVLTAFKGCSTGKSLNENEKANIESNDIHQLLS